MKQLWLVLLSSEDPKQINCPILMVMYGGIFYPEFFKLRLPNVCLLFGSWWQGMMGVYRSDVSLNVTHLHQHTTLTSSDTAPTMRQAEEAHYLRSVQSHHCKVEREKESERTLFKFLTTEAVRYRTISHTGSRANRVKVSINQKGIENLIRSSLVKFVR